MNEMYRIMVEGEDHTLFCYRNDVPEYQLTSTMDEAEEDYPCGQVWSEVQR